MKTRILATLFSLLTALILSGCIGSENSGTINGSGTEGEIKTYELTVNGKTWTILPAKVILTDNAEEYPETFTHDYTLTILAIDASNAINQDSKRLDISFNADDLAELKNVNVAEDENFQITYRGEKDIKAVKYSTESGIFTITEIDKKSATFVFNNLKLEGKSNTILLPGMENPTLTIQGEVKCAL